MKKNKGMKGIILAGGSATRLYPCTSQISKQMLPIYKAPMIFYPLNILIKAGIRDILVIVSPAHSGRFVNLLEPMFRRFGVRILSTVQEIPGGIAEAFSLGEGFIGSDNATLILGDNIYEDVDTISDAIKNFKKGGHIFTKEVLDPERFGVATVDRNGKVKSIKEKPDNPESNLAVTGAYVYDNNVVRIASNLKPSDRGELEITDINNAYLKKDALKMSTVKGEWLDAGTPDAYLEACNLAKEKKLYDKFDPIILEAIETGRERFKSQAKKLLK
jgi:glucose-1-phosphate thymidylyltransferase